MDRFKYIYIPNPIYTHTYIYSIYESSNTFCHCLTQEGSVGGDEGFGCLPALCVCMCVCVWVCVCVQSVWLQDEGVNEGNMLVHWVWESLASSYALIHISSAFFFPPSLPFQKRLSHLADKSSQAFWWQRWAACTWNHLTVDLLRSRDKNLVLIIVAWVFVSFQRNRTIDSITWTFFFGHFLYFWLSFSTFFFYLAALFILAVNACHFLLSLSHLVSLTLANNANLYIYLLLFFYCFYQALLVLVKKKCVYILIFIYLWGHFNVTGTVFWGQPS